MLFLAYAQNTRITVSLIDVEICRKRKDLQPSQRTSIPPNYTRPESRHRDPKQVGYRPHSLQSGICGILITEVEKLVTLLTDCVGELGHQIASLVNE